MAMNLQQLCQAGQEQLSRMAYVQAEQTLAQAEALAWAGRGTGRGRDFDTLSRLYMPLQEARRQRRLRCGEGTVCLDLLAASPDDHLDAQHVIENYPHGQLLVAGWCSTEPANQVRRLQYEHQLYLETFLAAVFPVGPGASWPSSPRPTRPAALPVRFHRAIIPPAPHRLDHPPPRRVAPRPPTRHQDTFARVLFLWHACTCPGCRPPSSSPTRWCIAGLRNTIEVDYACELAHQHLADTARDLARHPDQR